MKLEDFINSHLPAPRRLKDTEIKLILEKAGVSFKTSRVKVPARYFLNFLISKEVREEGVFIFGCEDMKQRTLDFLPQVKNNYVLFKSVLCGFLLNAPKNFVIQSPERIVTYPEGDSRIGAPKCGTKLFLSEARQLVEGWEKGKNILQDPTGEIFFEKIEMCWINACIEYNCGVYSKREEAKNSKEYGCHCGERTSTKISKFTIEYGERVLIQD